MGNESAEGASAGTAADHGNGIADRFKRGNSFLVDPVRTSGIGQFADAVEFLSGKRRLGRFHKEEAFSVTLEEFPAGPGIHFLFHEDGLTHDGELVILDFLEGGKKGEYGVIVRGDFAGGFSAEEPRGSGDSVERESAGKTAEDFQSCLLPHAEHEDVRLGIDQHGRTHFVLPVIVVGDTAETGFHSSQHHGKPGKGGLAELGVDDACMWRPESGAPPR